MKFRCLSWNDDGGKALATTVVREHDTTAISMKLGRIGFKCDDTTMVAIVSALRDAINITVFIIAI